MLSAILDPVRRARENLALPAAAKREAARDRRDGLYPDPGIPRAVDAAVAWLADAQDSSASRDGGVARHYSLITGWAASYPETTGYIVPTLLRVAALCRDETTRSRARRMLDWLVSIQLPGGGFQGGTIGQTPVVPVTFNTGQILLGLAAGVAELGEAYRPAMRRAADWLVETQDADGAWRSHPTPFAERGEKAYETHVAWGLMEAERADPGRGYLEAAERNVRWALGKQRPNGWFAACCLTDPARPLTHTLGYVLRGVAEAYRSTERAEYLEAARRTAEGLLGALGADGRLPGRLDDQWRPAVSWVCLTGTVQIAHCWLMLYRWTGDERYCNGAFRANAFVRRTIALAGPAGVRGGIKGSFPVDGGYGRFELLNWAAKFCIDAQLLEEEVRAGTQTG